MKEPKLGDLLKVVRGDIDDNITNKEDLRNGNIIIFIKRITRFRFFSQQKDKNDMFIYYNPLFNDFGRGWYFYRIENKECEPYFVIL